MNESSGDEESDADNARLMYCHKTDTWVPDTRGTKAMPVCHLLASPGTPGKSVIPPRKRKRKKKQPATKKKKRKKTPKTKKKVTKKRVTKKKKKKKK